MFKVDPRHWGYVRMLFSRNPRLHLQITVDWTDLNYDCLNNVLHASYHSQKFKVSVLQKDVFQLCCNPYLTKAEILQYPYVIQ